MPVKTKSNTRSKLTSLDALSQAAECLKTLAHPHRLRMVQMLLQGRYTVGDLAEACGIPSHMASEHLRLMQRCGFLSSEKEGAQSVLQNRGIPPGEHHGLCGSSVRRPQRVVFFTTTYRNIGTCMNIGAGLVVSNSK